METIDLLKKLVSYDSSSLEGVNATIDFVRVYLEKNGIEGEILEEAGYKSYVCTIGSGDKTLILNGHLDVVPAKNKSLFTPVEKDGMVYGRGTADMKAGCAVIINAILKLKEMPLKAKVMLQLVPDEEDGGNNGTRSILSKGKHGDFAIIGEPTMLSVSLQSKGFIRLILKVKGKSAHSSRPWQGENAIEKAYALYERIKGLPFLDVETPHLGRSTVNLSMISGGDLFNKVPESCQMSLDIRFIPEVPADEVISEIKAIADELEVCMIGSFTNISKDHPLIKRLGESYKAVIGEEIAYTYQHGSSDARFFTEYGIPAIEFGPSGNNWHGDNEAVSISSLKAYEAIIIDFASQFS